MTQAENSPDMKSDSSIPSSGSDSSSSSGSSNNNNNNNDNQSKTPNRGSGSRNDDTLPYPEAAGNTSASATASVSRSSNSNVAVGTPNRQVENNTRMTSPPSNLRRNLSHSSRSLSSRSSNSSSSRSSRNSRSSSNRKISNSHRNLGGAGGGEERGDRKDPNDVIAPSDSEVSSYIESTIAVLPYPEAEKKRPAVTTQQRQQNIHANHNMKQQESFQDDNGDYGSDNKNKGNKRQSASSSKNMIRKQPSAATVSTNSTSTTTTSGASLPYQEAGLPVRREKPSNSSNRHHHHAMNTPSSTSRYSSTSSSSSSKRKSRVKLGAKLKSNLSKLRKKRDSQYHQYFPDEENVNDISSSSSSITSHHHQQQQQRRSQQQPHLAQAPPEVLTSNGNSLPDVAPSRKKENPFTRIKRTLFGGDSTTTSSTTYDNLNHPNRRPTTNQHNDNKENYKDDYHHDFDKKCSNSVCYVLISIFLLALLLIGLEGGSKTLHHPPTYAPEPTRPPSTLHDGYNDPSGHGDFTIHQWKVHERLSIISSVDIDIPNSPQFKAAQWILNQDEMGYAEDSKYLPQRFVAAILYYKIEAGSDKCFELNESIDECEWNNIKCDTNGFVTELTMENCNIRGPVPIEMAWGFEKLKILDLSRNKLVGSFPTELELLTRLGKYIFIEYVYEYRFCLYVSVCVSLMKK